MNTFVIDQLNKEIISGTKLALVTVTKSTGSAPGRTGNMMLVYPDGSIVGTCGGGKVEFTIIKQAVECLKTGDSSEYNIVLEDIGMSCGGQMKGFIDVQMNDKQLVIVGGGHIGSKLYSLALELGFSITLIDDREEFANELKYPKARTISGNLTDILKKETFTDKYVVLVSKGHATDYQALVEVVDKDYKYLGLIGSKKKIVGLLSNLKEDGFNYTDYDNFYAPVGLGIAKNDPAEIALGILAEILLVKNNGKADHMRLKR